MALFIKDMSVAYGTSMTVTATDTFEPSANPRSAPTDQLMVPGTLNCISANRLWSVEGQKLRYSNPYNPLARNPFAEEQFSLPDGDAPTALVPYQQGVLIFGSSSALYLTGAPLLGGQFVPVPLSDGCIGP